jgi:hypothetical protein
MQPYYPADNLGLLCTSRQIHEEASAILFENIHVGSDAARAWRFLNSLGPDRIFKIRTVTIYYHCLEWCKPTAIHGDEELDWMPVLELLRSSAVRMDGVEVSFAPCVVDCRENNHYLQTRCRLWWDENSDRFWQGLETLNTVKQIRFLDPVPEYFVRRTTKRLGWGIHGELDGGYADPFQPLSRFKGLILNTTSANDSPASQQTGTHQSTGFLDLPLEIRHRIYNCACEWTYKPFWPDCPTRWNTGFSLLLVSKQISAEALPSIYRTFRVHGGRPLDDINKLGPKLAYIRRLEIHFSCFCPSGGRALRHNNDTLFAARASDAQKTPWPPSGISNPTSGRQDLENTRRTWTAAIRRLQSLRGLPELALTFQRARDPRPTNRNGT